MDGLSFVDGFDSFDVDGVIIDYAWSIVNSAELGSDVSIQVSEGPDAAEVTWIEGFTGDIIVQLQVTDDLGAIGTDTITISVLAEPTAVIASDGPILDTFSGGTVLDGTGSTDPLGDVLTYTWEVSDPSSVFLTDNLDGTATLEWDPGTTVTFDVSLTVTNSNDLSGFTIESFTLEFPVQVP